MNRRLAKKRRKKQEKADRFMKWFFNDDFVVYLQDKMLADREVTIDQWADMRGKYLERWSKRHLVEDAILTDPERAEQMLERIHRELSRRREATASEEETSMPDVF